MLNVHIGNKVIPFERGTNKLYFYCPKANDGIFNNVKQCFFTTLAETKNFYTDRQFEKAKQARGFYHAIGTPSTNDLLAILHMNLGK